MVEPTLHFSGVGLHSGAPSELTLRLGPPGHGIRFTHPDITGPSIPASPDRIVDDVRHTTLGDGQSISFATTEHCLAALAALHVWDVEIEVSNVELPILDGSAAPFAEALRQRSWARPLAPLIVKQPLSLRHGHATARITPASTFSIEVSINFSNIAVGQQRASWDGESESFLREVAPARTFGFLTEIKELEQAGLIAGGSLDNALVFGEKRPINEPRFENEPARHKLLDAVGDLALLGRPLAAHVELDRPSHALMHRVVKELFEPWS